MGSWCSCARGSWAMAGGACAPGARVPALLLLPPSPSHPPHHPALRPALLLQWVESRRGYDIKKPGSMDQDPIFRCWS